MWRPAAEKQQKIIRWAMLIGVPGAVALIAAAILVALMRAKPPVEIATRTPQPVVKVTPTSESPAPSSIAPASFPSTPGAPSLSMPATNVSSPTPTQGAAPAGSSPAATPSGSGPSTSVSSATAPTEKAPSAEKAIWPGFRGPGRMNISAEHLCRSFPSQGPKKLWAISLGEGHAGAAVYKGRVFVLDYNVATRRDELKCLDLNTGRVLWTQGYSVDIKNNHGRSRTVPATDGKYVVSLGPMGHLMCCRADNGQLLWLKDLQREFGAVIPPWYNGQCPLLEDGKIIIATGGKALMAAFAAATGNVIWRTPNPQGWQMTHSSIMPVAFAGKRIYIYPASKGVIGVNARDGKLLWATTEWTVPTANIPTPVPIGEGKIFVCGGYNSGAAILQMGPEGESVRVVKRIPPHIFQSHQQTPILYKGYLYAVRIPGELVCLDLEGNVRWTSGSTARFGLGPYVMAQGLLYVLSDRGELAIVEANPSSYKELARAKVLFGGDAWAPMAIADGKLICRDVQTMICLDMSP